MKFILKECKGARKNYEANTMDRFCISIVTLTEKVLDCCSHICMFIISEHDKMLNRSGHMNKQSDILIKAGAKFEEHTGITFNFKEHTQSFSDYKQVHSIY